ncbi:hypothetical protein BpHYR1_035487 [Brachionus plicatilis]|uniref:Uncharacterized protein n=1 Tax=Brachionus plicatilis TaxID=10195 RepID=A0A3M7QG92_BRAPC|nr:hypothetical protein BpHYR1_035487 [Brachionus plicatilis]
MDKLSDANLKSEDIENFQPADSKSRKMMSRVEQDDDVFGFEEDSQAKRYLDSDSEEENDDLSDKLNEKQILQKRSSNQNLHAAIQIKNSSHTHAAHGKYSCSLPRDIISNRYSVANESENDRPNLIMENEDSRFESDDEYEKCGDMGLAISNLASSIVAKDGRELFGGVPSRRIPINNISQSYF